MSDHLARFNALPDQEAEDQLYAGFADRSWAARVASGRPYRDLDHLLDVAELAWSELKPGDWLRAFRAHPRIGEQGGHAPAVSEREQSGVPAKLFEFAAAGSAAGEMTFKRGFFFAFQAPQRVER